MIKDSPAEWKQAIDPIEKGIAMAYHPIQKFLHG
jgi:hypothetical protein